VAEKVFSLFDEMEKWDDDRFGKRVLARRCPAAAWLRILTCHWVYEADNYGVTP
jgi:hypothetical protein